MDWSDNEGLPRCEHWQVVVVIDQGGCSQGVKTIKENAGEILGFRDLALDNIEPLLFRDADCTTWLQRGLDYVRPFDRATDEHLPVFSTVGFWMSSKNAAEHCIARAT